MIFPTGNNPISANAKLKFAGAFTLIELILVMAMLAVVLSVAWPSLSPFFRGRHLDSESKRLLALTRYGQSRAISEGLPMILWISQDLGAYGLRADASYLEDDDREIEYEMEKSITLEVEIPPAGSRIQTTSGQKQPIRGLSEIRFYPDGFLRESNPEWIALRQAEAEPVVIGLSRNRLYYEFQTNTFILNN